MKISRNNERVEGETNAYRFGRHPFQYSQQILGKTISGVAKAAKMVAKGAICGNLSPSLQKRIEKMTNGAYSPEDATVTSLFTNFASYPLIYYGTRDHNIDLSNILNFYALAIVYLFGESMMRAMAMDVNNIKKNTIKGCASVPGKIISIPLELLVGVYDRFKK